ncbi:acyl-CoA dehydrogenase [candidate division TA06 bacterium DG_26]|uniref:Acyl-CoA dehydrogenase n=1 Tax=candidate division TA06 bacterium DG_26 TaxID=1703771 RepID=A0A0S7WKZ9_UNCT6|nr:MAG: acyl-CoA dehydrogenase [candidate division TA06 bacterium DG_26]
MVLDTKYQRFRDEVREFATQVVAPKASHIDQTGEFSWDTAKEMGRMGLLGIPFPKKYGGAGLDHLSYAIAVEEISRVCGSTGVTLAAHVSLGCYPIYASGTEKQKRKFLPPLLKGDKIGSFGLTEPNAGSDAGATETTAELAGDEWIINGTKRFITSGAIADTMVITATQDRSKGVHGISAFIVEKGSPGFSPGREEEKLGLRGSITSELVFEDCRIPKENLLGQEYEGFKIFMQTLDGGRISIGAMALGIGQGALDASIEYAQNRVQFGKPLRKFQLIQRMIADMETEISAARHLVYHAAMLKDGGEVVTKEGAMAKLYASEACMRATSAAIQIHGCRGLTNAYPVERFFRDAKLTEIGEGTSEIMRIVIAREILGR